MLGVSRLSLRDGYLVPVRPLARLVTSDKKHRAATLVKMNSSRTSVAPDDPGRNSFKLGSFDPAMVSTSGRPRAGPSSASTVIALLTCTSVTRSVFRSSWSQDRHGSMTITVHAIPSFQCDLATRIYPLRYNSASHPWAHGQSQRFSGSLAVTQRRTQTSILVYGRLLSSRCIWVKSGARCAADHGTLVRLLEASRRGMARCDPPADVARGRESTALAVGPACARVGTRSARNARLPGAHGRA